MLFTLQRKSGVCGCQQTDRYQPESQNMQITYVPQQQQPPQQQAQQQHQQQQQEPSQHQQQQQHHHQHHHHQHQHHQYHEQTHYQTPTSPDGSQSQQMHSPKYTSSPYMAAMVAPPTPPDDECVYSQQSGWFAQSTGGSGTFQQSQQYQQTGIDSYYYDINDEFSDIMSAPSTPEPVMGAVIAGEELAHQPGQVQSLHQHQHPYQYQHQQQHQHQHQLQHQHPHPQQQQQHQHSHQHQVPHQHQQPQVRPLHQLPLQQQVQQVQQHPQLQQIQVQPQVNYGVATSGLPSSGPPAHRSSPIHLWEFLKELLQQVEAGCADATVIRWLDKQKGVFKIEDSVRVAKLWGKRKNKPKMNYDKLSRSIRQYYKKGIMKKTDRSQRLVYQFCSAYCH